MPPAVSTSPCFRSTDVARPSPGFEATSGASTVGLAHRDVNNTEPSPSAALRKLDLCTALLLMAIRAPRRR
jgi:hypothetical protein